MVMNTCFQTQVHVFSCPFAGEVFWKSLRNLYWIWWCGCILSMENVFSRPSSVSGGDCWLILFSLQSFLASLGKRIQRSSWNKYFHLAMLMDETKGDRYPQRFEMGQACLILDIVESHVLIWIGRSVHKSHSCGGSLTPDDFGMELPPTDVIILHQAV